MKQFLFNAFPVAVVSAAILVIWYLGAIWLNADWTLDRAEKAGKTLTTIELVDATWSQKKPKLPAPHQIVEEIWKTTVE